MLYSALPSFILGFHGCAESVARKVVEKRQHLRFSTNEYDWLGSGVYFWEHSPQRAMEWAKQLKRRGEIDKPAVVGAIIDLGECLNLLDREYLLLVKDAYEALVEASTSAKKPLPQNKTPRGNPDLLLRNLDCATINLCRKLREQSKLTPFDTVRAAFIEGRPLYEGAGFCDRNHIQVCVCNTRCIKGYFLPLKG